MSIYICKSIVLFYKKDTDINTTITLNILNNNTSLMLPFNANLTFGNTLPIPQPGQLLILSLFPCFICL